MTTPLVDVDVLLYEVGFASEKRITAAENTIYEEVHIEPQSWDFAKEVFDKRIKLICDEVGATTDPILFITESGLVNKLLNKKRKWLKEPELEYKPNFRDEIAKTKEYKGNRKSSVKPFHYKNLVSYVLCGKWHYEVAPPGLEADDALCIYQTKAMRDGKSTIICSRDKDLRQCKGLSYSWECGKQASVGPIIIDELGSLVNKNENKFQPNGKPLPLKVFGTGEKFFYYQMLTGDSVDNIQGLINRGPTFSYNLLKDAKTIRECYELVAEVYVKQLGSSWEDTFREMADLLYIIKDVDDNGDIIKWSPPKMIT